MLTGLSLAQRWVRHLRRLHGRAALALKCTAPSPERGTLVLRESPLIYESAVSARPAPTGVSVTSQVV